MDEKKVKKVNDYMYKVEMEGDMNVPVHIYASDKLMENMKRDRCIDQGRNVATLPGILKASIMLSDAHQGYGFSIGGVAAFDSDTGIITPGGIGFDINCLTKGSKVLTEHGYYKKIEDFENNFIEVENAHEEYNLKTTKFHQSLISFDSSQKSFSSNEATFFMKKKYSDPIYQIKTKLGYKINVTGDHPILTKNGMTNAKNLIAKQHIAIFPFSGVQYEKLHNKELVNEIVFTAQQKKHLKERNLLPLNLNNPRLPTITKLFGYLLGDGNIYFSGQKGFVNAYGPKEDLIKIKEDFKKLGFSANIYSRSRNHNIPTKYGKVEFTSENHELHVSSKSLAKLFCELGYPKGNKTSTPFLIPDWIMKSPLWIKRLFLSGLFGAELSKPRTHTKTGFDCPILSINKNSNLLKNAREFAIQVMQLLEKFNVNTHKLLQRKDYFNKQGPTHRLKLQISSQENNLLNLWEKIGFSYNKKRDLISQMAILYIKEKKLLTKKRKDIAKKVKELRKKGLTLKEVQRLLVSDISNARFIERHYYENAGQRISLDFLSFKDFIKIKQNEIDSYGCLFDNIKSIEKVEYDDYVYDFNIEDTHTFVANNIVVSNCGVRVLTSNLTKEEVESKVDQLLDELFKRVPCGVGKKSQLRLSQDELDEVMTTGANWCVKNGYGSEEDLDYCESNGKLPGADPKKVSPKARGRGLSQLGTLGAGNHFVEVQFVDKIYDEEVAKKFGIKKENQVVVMIHCGSRGFGHQICSDYLRKMEDKFPDIMAALPEKDLIYAPYKSSLGQDYFAAMNCAGNYAWANRHMIGHHVKEGFKTIFGKETNVKTLYDVAHNIGKIEEHEIKGKKRKIIVHRKGATRAFPKDHPDVPTKYREVGQPVMIPGSMGTSSWILVGTQKGLDETFGSSVHGAGRVMSRNQANREFRAEKVKNDLSRKNITVKSASWRGISEEAPGVYKDVDEVVDVMKNAGISRPVARLKPIGVIKG